MFSPVILICMTGMSKPFYQKYAKRKYDAGRIYNF